MKLGIPKRERSKKQALWAENESCIIIHGKNMSLKGTGAKFELSEQAHADLSFASTKLPNKVSVSFEAGEMFLVNTTELEAGMLYRNNRSFNDTKLYKYLISQKAKYPLTEDVMYKIPVVKVEDTPIDGVEGTFAVVKVLMNEGTVIRSNDDSTIQLTVAEGDSTPENSFMSDDLDGGADTSNEESDTGVFESPGVPAEELNTDFSAEREEASQESTTTHEWGE